MYTTICLNLETTSSSSLLETEREFLCRTSYFLSPESKPTYILGRKGSREGPELSWGRWQARGRSIFLLFQYPQHQQPLYKRSTLLPPSRADPSASSTRIPASLLTESHRKLATCAHRMWTIASHIHPNDFTSVPKTYFSLTDLLLHIFFRERTGQHSIEGLPEFAIQQLCFVTQEL